MSAAPCLNCSERCVNCHSTCDSYKSWQQARSEEKQRVTSARQIILDGDKRRNEAIYRMIKRHKK